MTELAIRDCIDFKGNFMHRGLDSDHSITGNCVYHIKFGLNVQNGFFKKYMNACIII